MQTQSKKSTTQKQNQTESEKQSPSTSGEIRKALSMALVEACNGRLSATDGKNIVGIANQIANSIKSEVQAQTMQTKMGHQVSVLGSLKVI